MKHHLILDRVIPQTKHPLEQLQEHLYLTSNTFLEREKRKKASPTTPLNLP
jgi:hypothetical protein